MNDSKDRLDDLASLFIPDILHHVSPPASGHSETPSTSGGVTVKQEDLEYSYHDQRDTIDSMTSPTSKQQTGGLAGSTGAGNSSTSVSNYNNFMNNNNFIGSASGYVGGSPSASGANTANAQNQQHSMMPFDFPMAAQHIGQHSHYKPKHRHQHMTYSLFPLNPYGQLVQPSQAQNQQQMASSGSQSSWHNQQQLQMLQQAQQLQQFQQFQQQAQPQMQDEVYMQMMQFQQPHGLHTSNSATNFLNASFTKNPSRDLGWFGPNGLDSNMAPQNNGSNVYASNSPFIQSSEKIISPEPEALGDMDASNMDSAAQAVLESTEPAKKKLKTKKNTIKGSEYSIGYTKRKCKLLLDFKNISGLSDTSDEHKIIDKDDNEVKVDFNGFLNGRFLTNDTDNIVYISSKKDEDRAKPASDQNEAEIADRSVKQDPRVISCYRRNYIQISMNMHISGVSSNDKLLRVRSSEYGYSITRVIKYFKIEVSAVSNLNDKSVPIFIKTIPKERLKVDKEKKDDESIIASSINDSEHIVILNDDVSIENGEINEYFIIKKLQFKSATPNNGNSTFQNYYRLKIKLSAVVADLYYDDYVDEDVNNMGGSGQGGSGQDNNEIVLHELRSEPIIVRGRNPNFYTDKNDILIEGRSSTSKKSFILSERDEGDEDEGEELQGISNRVQNRGDKQQASQQRQLSPEQDEIIPRMAETLEEEDEDISSGAASSAEEEVTSQRDSRPPSDSTDRQSSSESFQKDQNKNSSVPPLAYSGTNRTVLDLKSINRYKYFPISNVYYLPPINAVYFPHRAHQGNGSKDSETNQRVDEIVNERRKSSNVYFK